MDLIKLHTPELIKEFFGDSESKVLPNDAKVVLIDNGRLFPLAGQSLSLVDGEVVIGTLLCKEVKVKAEKNVKEDKKKVKK